MRAIVTDRHCRTFMGLRTDRVPDVEFGYWPQTIRRRERSVIVVDKFGVLAERFTSETDDRSVPPGKSNPG
jgi:hypothetical protein